MKRTVASLCLLVCLTARVNAADLESPERPIPAVIDHYIQARLVAEKVKAADQAGDATLLRRITLDLIGRIPAPIEVQEYLKSNDPNKRTRLIERLMNSPEYVEHQADQFDTFMTQGNGGMSGYLQTAFKENRSWDRIFRDVLIGDPKDPKTKDAASFLVSRVKDVDRLTNDVSVVFFGINVSCAKCHDHPLVEDWKQDHFYGMKSFFNRTFAAGKYLGEREYGEVSYKTTAGETRNAKLMFLTGTVVKEPKGNEPSAKERRERDAEIKRLIKQKKQPPPARNSRRQQLVDIALKPGENRFFARAIVNRVWHQYMGYGLVMPLDQMHSANPPSHPQLLDWLARDFASHGYDLRRLVKGIVSSRAYARSSQAAGDNRPVPSLFAVAAVKPLTPKQLARSLNLAAADPDSFADKNLKPEQRAERIRNAASTRHADKFELPGDNFQVSADEALYFSNSPEVQKELLGGGLVNRLSQLKDPERVAETAVWTVLSREPTKDEVKSLADYLRSRSDRPEQARQQIVWALMTCSEFRFNH